MSQQTPSAEFYFTRNGVDYTVYPTGNTTSTYDEFNILHRRTNDYLDTIKVAHTEDVEEAFARWL